MLIKASYSFILLPLLSLTSDDQCDISDFLRSNFLDSTYDENMWYLVFWWFPYFNYHSYIQFHHIVTKDKISSFFEWVAFHYANVISFCPFIIARQYSNIWILCKNGSVNITSTDWYNFPWIYILKKGTLNYGSFTFTVLSNLYIILHMNELISNPTNRQRNPCLFHYLEVFFLLFSSSIFKVQINYIDFLFVNIGYSHFCSLPYFSAMLYDCHCRGPSHLSLNLFFSVFIR